MADDVDKMHGDHAGIGAAFRVGADPPEVMCVAKADADQSGFPGPSDGEVRSLSADDLAEAETTVREHNGAGVAAHRHVGIRLEVPAFDVADVGGHHADAVGVVALEVREHQMIGGLLGKGLGCAGGLENLHDEATERLCID